MAKEPARPRKAPARKPAKGRSRRPAEGEPPPPAETGVAVEPEIPPLPPPPWDAAAASWAPPAAPAAPAWPAARSPFLPGAIAAMVVGLVSIWMFPAGLLLGPLAIGLAVYALRLHRADPALQGRGMAVAGLATGIAGVLLGAGFVAFLVFEEVWDPDAEDRGADIEAVQAGLLSRNADADAARELVVAVAAWDDERQEPLGYAGVVEVLLETSSDGVTWMFLANETVEVEPEPDDGFSYAPAVTYVEFKDAELDLDASYRARVAVTVEATGGLFEDETAPVAGDGMPEHFSPWG